MPVYDLSSGFNILNNGIQNLGNSLNNGWQLQQKQQLGQALMSGNYDQAASLAASLGDVNSAMQLKTLGANTQMAAHPPQLSGGVFGDVSTGGSPTGGVANGAPQATAGGAAGTVATPTGGAGALSPLAPKAAQYFMGNGVVTNPLGASALAAGFQAESGYNPGAIAKGDGSDGSDSINIGQWNGPRAVDFRNFYQANKLNPSDPATGLAFAKYELQNKPEYAGIVQQLNQAKTPEEAQAAAIGYWAPKGYTASNPTAAVDYPRRVGYTKAIFGSLQGQPQQGQPGPANPGPVQTASLPPAQQGNANANANPPAAVPGAPPNSTQSGQSGYLTPQMKAAVGLPPTGQVASNAPGLGYTPVPQSVPTNQADAQALARAQAPALTANANAAAQQPAQPSQQPAPAPAAAPAQQSAVELDPDGFQEAVNSKNDLPNEDPKTNRFDWSKINDPTALADARQKAAKYGYAEDPNSPGVFMPAPAQPAGGAPESAIKPEALSPQQPGPNAPSPQQVGGAIKQTIDQLPVGDPRRVQFLQQRLVALQQASLNPVGGQYYKPLADQVAGQLKIEQDVATKLAEPTDKDRDYASYQKNYVASGGDPKDMLSYNDYFHQSADQKEVGTPTDQDMTTHGRNPADASHYQIVTKGSGKGQLTAIPAPDLSDSQKFDVRTQQADRLGLQGNERKFFIANGTIPTARTLNDMTPAERKDFDTSNDTLAKQNDAITTLERARNNAVNDQMYFGDTSGLEARAQRLPLIGGLFGDAQKQATSQATDADITSTILGNLKGIFGRVTQGETNLYTGLKPNSSQTKEEYIQKIDDGLRRLHAQNDYEQQRNAAIRDGTYGQRGTVANPNTAAQPPGQQSQAGKPSPADALGQAKAALAAGADRGAVIKRLQQNGYDASGL